MRIRCDSCRKQLRRDVPFVYLGFDWDGGPYEHTRRLFVHLKCLETYCLFKRMQNPNVPFVYEPGSIQDAAINQANIVVERERRWLRLTQEDRKVGMR